jgi:hypothetical protein
MAITANATLVNASDGEIGEVRIFLLGHITHDTVSGEYAVSVEPGIYRIAVFLVETEAFTDAGTINSLLGAGNYLNAANTVPAVAAGVGNLYLSSAATATPATTYTIVKGAIQTNAKLWQVHGLFGHNSGFGDLDTLSIPHGFYVAWTKGATPGTAGEFDLYAMVTRID